MTDTKQEVKDNSTTQDSGVPLGRLVMRPVDTDPPPSGTLCLVYFPVGDNNLTGKSSGPVAAAYKVDGGWKMADTPSPLRGLLGEVGPAYWQELLF